LASWPISIPLTVEELKERYLKEEQRNLKMEASGADNIPSELYKHGSEKS
jgi:hypothetical protein